MARTSAAAVGISGRDWSGSDLLEPELIQGTIRSHHIDRNFTRWDAGDALYNVRSIT